MANPRNFKEAVDYARQLNEITKQQIADEGIIDSTLQDREEILNRIIENKNNANELADIQAELEEKIAYYYSIGHNALAEKYEVEKGIVELKQEELEATENINNALKDGANTLLGGMIDKAEKLAEVMKKPGGALLLGIMAAVALIKSFADVTDEVGDSFGAIGVKKFRGDIIAAKADAVALGYGFQEASQTIEELSNNFSIGFEQASKMAGTSMEVAKALGVSVDTSAKLIGQMMTIGGHTAESASNALKMTAQLAASKGVAPGIVMQDMAEASEAIATYSKDGGDNMRNAAVQARQMGLSLSDTAAVMDNLLDFQSSLQKELEASVLTGKQLNLQKARELALNNDITGAMDEVLNQLGSEAQWNNLNAIQRKALADSIGVGVDKMSQMVEFSGKTNEELARMGKSIAGEEAMSSISAMMFAFKSLGTQILAGIAYVFEFFDSLFEGGGVVGVLLLGLVVVAAMVALWMGAMYLSGLAAGAGLAAAGTGAATSAPGFAALGTAGMVAVPVLFAIALIGLSLVGIIYAIGYVLKQLPPIITALAEGFVMIAEAITSSILQLVTPEVIAGVYLLAGGFFFLAMSLAALAFYGLMALPALAGVALFAAGMTAMGFSAENITKIVMGGLGGKDPEKQSQMEEDIAAIKSAMQHLVRGFGGNPGDKDYVKDIGKAVSGQKIVAKLNPPPVTI